MLQNKEPNRQRQKFWPIGSYRSEFGYFSFLWRFFQNFVRKWLTLSLGYFRLIPKLLTEGIKVLSHCVCLYGSLVLVKTFRLEILDLSKQMTATLSSSQNLSFDTQIESRLEKFSRLLRTQLQTQTKNWGQKNRFFFENPSACFLEFH